MTFFITGIDTGIGKTLATGLAARWLHQHEKKVITQKLVQTGQTSPISEDVLEHRRLMGIAPLPEDLEGTTCPYSFAYPASPHLAARLEGCTIEPNHITQATKTLQERYEIVLLEGAGGFLVPLTPDLLLADYIEQQGYPVILVTSGRLGSINHTLLTIAAIRQRNLPLACIVFNQYPAPDAVIGTDSLAIFRRICPNVVAMPSLGHISNWSGIASVIPAHAEIQGDRHHTQCLDSGFRRNDSFFAQTNLGYAPETDCVPDVDFSCIYDAVIRHSAPSHASVRSSF